jgi:hypothetical protein
MRPGGTIPGFVLPTFVKRDLSMKRAFTSFICVISLIGIGHFEAFSAEKEVDLAKDVVRKAIKAQGGKKNLSRLMRCFVRHKGIRFAEDEEMPFRAEYWYEAPARIRYIVRITSGGEKMTIIRILDGQLVWEKVNGYTRKLKGRLAQEMKANAHGIQVSNLYPLLRDRAYRLSHLGTSKVNCNGSA